MKKIILLLSLLVCALVAYNQVKVVGPVTTNAPSDLYPTHFDSLGMGGYIAGPSISYRNSISSARRKNGMLVYCADVDTIYKLQSDLVTWIPFSSGSGIVKYTWVDNFDDSVTNTGGSMTGLNNVFTLSQIPSDTASVFQNGLRLREGQDYTLQGKILTILPSNNFILGSNTLSRSANVVTVTLVYPWSGASQGNIITVSGAANNQLNGNFVISSVISPTVFTYTTTTSGSASESSATVALVNLPSKKTQISVVYSYSSPQTISSRYNTNQVINVLFYGNSLFYGVGSQHGITDPVALSSLMLPTVPLRIVNLGTPGITTTSLTTQIPSVLSPQMSASFSKNIIVFTEYINSYAANPTKTSDVLYQEAITLKNSIKALNPSAQVINTTVLSNTSYMPDSVRNNLNGFIIANAGGFDAVVNTAANTFIGVTGASTNQTYFRPDGIHLQPEGYFTWAQAIYPIVMSQASLAIQNISSVQIPVSLTWNKGGNFDLATPARDSIGTWRRNFIDVLMNGKIIQTWDTSGTTIVNPAINAYNNGFARGFSVVPALSGNTTGDVYAGLYVAPTFSNAQTAVRNIALFRDSVNHKNVFRILQTASNGLYDIFADSANLYGGAFRIPYDINSLTTPTTGGVFFNGTGDGTANGFFIARSSNSLYYNVGNNLGHIFTTQGIERFAVKSSNQVQGAVANNFVNTSTQTVDATTTGGFVFTSPGGQPTQINRNTTMNRAIDIQTPSTNNSYIAMWMGVTPALTIDRNANLSTALANSSGSISALSSAGAEFKGSNFSYPSMRLLFGNAYTQATPSITSMSRTSPSAGAVITFASSHGLIAGSRVSISGSTEPTFNGIFTVTTVLSNTQVVVTTVATTTVVVSSGISALGAPPALSGVMQNDGTNMMIPNNGITVLGSNSLFQDNATIAANPVINSSVLLDMQSITKGFRAPQMTTVQRNAISSPVDGLQVYDNSVKRLTMYNGTQWYYEVREGVGGIAKDSLPIVTSAGPYYSVIVDTVTSQLKRVLNTSFTAWLQGGNSFGATGVLGTLDANPLDLYSNNARAMRLFTTGNIGVNTIVDGGFKFDVNGTGRFSSTSSAALTIVGNSFTTTFGPTTNTIAANSTTVSGALNLQGAPANSASLSIQSVTYTGGGAANRVVSIAPNLSPTSGILEQISISMAPVINQSGTYTGPTFGVLYNPTVTNINTGNRHFAYLNTRGMNALNVSAGSTTIGDSALTSFKFYVNGSVAIKKDSIPIVSLPGPYYTLVEDTTTNQVKRILTTSVSNAWVQGGNAFGTTGILGTTDNNPLDFYTNNTGKMRIFTSGNVGIGTTTDAGFKLDLVSGSMRAGDALFNGASFSSTTISLNSGHGGVSLDNVGAAITGDLVILNPTGGQLFIDNLTQGSVADSLLTWQGTGGGKLVRKIAPSQLRNTILPSQTGNAGYFLQTNGSNASWQPLLPQYDQVVCSASTPTLIATIAAQQDNVTTYNLRWVVTSTSGGDAGSFETIVLVKNISGTASIVGSMTNVITPILDTNFSTAAVTANTSGGNLRLYVNNGSYSSCANWRVEVNALSPVPLAP